MKYTAHIDNTSYDIDIEETGGKLLVRLDGVPMDVDFMKLGEGFEYSLLVGNSSYELILEERTGSYTVTVDGQAYPVSVQSDRERRLTSEMPTKKRSSDSEEILAPMPGLVVDIEVAVGDTVAEGDGLVIVEAMKMENELIAHSPGMVKEIRIQKGETVENNQVLVVIEAHS